MDSENPLVQNHVRKGGIAAIYDDGYLVILQQDWVHRIEHVERVPVTLGGRAPFMIANALAASLAAFVQGIKVEQIRAALRSFKASAQQAPGRMNLFNLGSYHVLVDYAHNLAGYEAVGGFVKNWSGPTIGVVGGPGDRRDEDLTGLGQLAATFFDHIIVKEDDDGRGRPAGNAAELIVQGIAQVPESSVSHFVQLDETTAIQWALDHAPKDSLVVIFPEKVSRAIELIKERNPIVDVPKATASDASSNSSPLEPMSVSS